MTGIDLVFLDANVLFSAAWASSIMRRLWVLTGTLVTLVTSDQAVDEAMRNLPPARHADLLELLLHVA